MTRRKLYRLLLLACLLVGMIAGWHYQVSGRQDAPADVWRTLAVDAAAYAHARTIEAGLRR